MHATAASNAEVPPGITSRIEREWKVTTSVKDIDMNAVGNGIYFVQLITFDSQSKTLKLLRD